MKKLLLFLFVFYLSATAQIHKHSAKSNDICEVITMGISPPPMNIKMYSTNVPSVRPKYKLVYEKWVGPGDKVIYYLDIRVAALTNRPKAKGVSIFLKNGKKLLKPDEVVATDPRTGDFERSALIKLTGSDLAMLKQNPITGFKLYDSVAHVDKPEQYCELLNCLVYRN